MSVKAAVVSNPCASTAATVGSGMALLSWGASEAGIDLPSWVTALLTGGVVCVALAIGTAGVVGVLRYLLYGSNGRPS